jgi:hypothetical protein
MNFQHILKQDVIESLGHKRKWESKKGLKHWNDHIEKVMNKKEKPSKTFINR